MTDVPARGRPSVRTTSRAALARVLAPGTDPAMSVPGTLAVLLAAFAVAVLRHGWLPDAPLYAEDGTVFLAGDTSGTAFPSLLVQAYNGYAHVLPRLVTRLASTLPLPLTAVVFALVSALVQAAVATLGYVVTRAHRRALAPALLVAALATVIPVGREVLLNVANLQWWLLLGGVLCLLWTPAGWWGRAVQAGFVLAVACSCPFGFLVAGIALARLLVVRTRGDLLVAACALGGLLVEAAVIVAGLRTPGARPSNVNPVFYPPTLGGGYLRFVVADGALGSMPWLRAYPVAAVAIGSLLAVAGTLVVLRRARRTGWLALTPVLLLVVVSLLAYAVPVILMGGGAAPPFPSARYYVTPVVLLFVALVLTASGARDAVMPAAVGPEAVGPEGGTPGVGTDAADRPPRRIGALGAVLAGVVLVAVACYPVPHTAVDEGPSWSSEVERGRAACAADPAATPRLTLAPAGWELSLSCPVLARR